MYLNTIHIISILHNIKHILRSIYNKIKFTSINKYIHIPSNQIKCQLSKKSSNGIVMA